MSVCCWGDLIELSSKNSGLLQPETVLMTLREKRNERIENVFMARSLLGLFLQMHICMYAIHSYPICHIISLVAVQQYWWQLFSFTNFTTFFSPRNAAKGIVQTCSLLKGTTNKEVQVNNPDFKHLRECLYISIMWMLTYIRKNSSLTWHWFLCC